MAYFQKQEARAAAGRYRSQRGLVWKTPGQILSEQRRAATDTDRFDVFLSHSSQDAEIILGVKAILESVGLQVYVDWIDDAQLDRSNVNRETADLLRRRMRQANSLVWAATDAASRSKWMPWELGYFDGFRPNHVAILPLLDSPGEGFQGQEYLALYPVAQPDRVGTYLRSLFIVDRGREVKTFEAFAR